MKTCQRCFVEFNCQSAEIDQCDCSTVCLKDETLAFLKKTHYDCLCTNCLLEVDEMVSTYGQDSLPTNGQQMREGVHYYFNEEGLFVMTEVYHFLRGYCCGNGCKHCAYGHGCLSNSCE